ncbi:MAG: CDGSH iron-sulfur domain-containing protein 2 [Paramarteilia canceri]
MVNNSIKKTENKVVDHLKISKDEGSKAFCRCWQSDNFPYCDGSHNDFNQETGDNLGPLLVEVLPTDEEANLTEEDTPKLERAD